MPGKMLHTRLCAATEMAPTASLCHDDVLDGARLRRGRPGGGRVSGGGRLSDRRRPPGPGGREEAAGKTLGTDLLRGKYTLAQEPGSGTDLALGQMSSLLGSAVECVSAWPLVVRSVRRFVRHDLRPVRDRHLRRTAEVG